MRTSFDPGLVKSVKEHFCWQGDRSSHPVRFVKNAGGLEMLLVRFTNVQGVKMSGLMDFVPWKDGHWDVSEFESVSRENEAKMIRKFEKSGEYKVVVCEEDTVYVCG